MPAVFLLLFFIERAFNVNMALMKMFYGRNINFLDVVLSSKYYYLLFFIIIGRRCHVGSYVVLFSSLNLLTWLNMPQVNRGLFNSQEN